MYTSGFMEFALLETTVHFDGTPPFDLPPYILITIRLPENAVVYPDPTQLPTGWHLFDDYPGEELNAFLQNEFRRTNSLGLAVPSVIIPHSSGRNVLLDPLNPRGKVVEITSYEIDPRLL